MMPDPKNAVKNDINANDDFKAKANYVSPFDLTAGVMDILDRIMRGEL